MVQNTVNKSFKLVALRETLHTGYFQIFTLWLFEGREKSSVRSYNTEIENMNVQHTTYPAYKTIIGSTISQTPRKKL